MFIQAPQAAGARMGIEPRLVNACSRSPPPRFFLKKPGEDRPRKEVGIAVSTGASRQ